ncbi:MAG: phosphate signaling complex protein PhoU [Acidimicrobiales bacterium]
MAKIRSQLDERLDHIRLDLLTMIDMVAVRISDVTAALLERDVARADRIIVTDDDVDLLSQQIEDQCLDILIREQPVAGDLRAVVAALHMNSDVERSGDLTTNIAKAVGRLQGTQADDRTRNLILRMSQEARRLFERSADAYRELDADLAATIDSLDDVLDDLHRDYIQVVIQGAQRGVLLPQQSLQLALIGRFYERIGDHAENLGERIRYIVDGWTPERAGADRARQRADHPVGGDGELATSRGLAIIDSIAERRRIDATRRDFVANVSHELKTPIGAISLLAETLVDAEPGEDRERLAGHLNREVKRVADIIDDLLELTRLEEFEPDRDLVDVDALVSEAADLVRGLADARGIEITVVGTPSGLTMDGERRQLMRALVNLIDNAVRYSDPDSRVTVGVESLPGAVALSVADTGMGIPRPELERIFERFYRVDRARSRDTGGTGLGLSIVRHVADKHGGRVLVESKLGAGTTFTLHLPETAP